MNDDIPADAPTRADVALAQDGYRREQALASALEFHKDNDVSHKAVVVTAEAFYAFLAPSPPAPAKPYADV